MTHKRRILLGLAALVVGAAVWLPTLHLLYARPAANFHTAAGVPPDAEPLLRRQLALLQSADLRAQAVSPMRAANPEWDFMGRSFLAWSLANWSLRDRAHEAEALAAIDHLIDDTQGVDKQQSMYAFLMPY